MQGTNISNAELNSVRALNASVHEMPILMTKSHRVEFPMHCFENVALNLVIITLNIFSAALLLLSLQGQHHLLETRFIHYYVKFLDRL